MEISAATSGLAPPFRSIRPIAASALLMAYARSALQKDGFFTRIVSRINIRRLLATRGVADPARAAPIPRWDGRSYPGSGRGGDRETRCRIAPPYGDGARQQSPRGSNLLPWLTIGHAAATPTGSRECPEFLFPSAH